MADADTRPRGHPPSPLEPDSGQITNSLITTYLSVLSHEVRAPLAGVRGYTELLLSGGLGEVNDRQQQALSRIGQLEFELEYMVENLVFTVQRSVDGLKPFIETVSLTKVMERVLHRLHGLCASTGVTVEVADEASPASRHLYADPRLLERALTNVVGNAVACSSHGGTVTVMVDGNGGEVTVRVIDHGSGIAQSELARLLASPASGEPVPALSLAGPGFGLMVTDAVIRGHGGELSVVSEPSAGTTVTVTVPIREPHD